MAEEVVRIQCLSLNSIRILIINAISPAEIITKHCTLTPCLYVHLYAQHAFLRRRSATFSVHAPQFLLLARALLPKTVILILKLKNKTKLRCFSDTSRHTSTSGSLILW